MSVDELFRGLVIVPFVGVPIALVTWTILHLMAKSILKAIGGLLGGGALCFGAFLLFLTNVYCESCAGRPVQRHEAIAIIAYFAFGVAMLLALWFTRPKKR